MRFIRGKRYTRHEIWEAYVPDEPSPRGGGWMTGYARPKGLGDELMIFMNIGIRGNAHRDRKSFNFENAFDQAKGRVTWFGKQGSHSGQPTISKLISGEWKAQIFARWKEGDPFTYLGEGEYLESKDPEDFDSEAVEIQFRCHDYGSTLQSQGSPIDPSLASDGSSRNRDFPLPGDISRAGLEAAMDRIDQDGFDPHGANTTYAIIARDKAYPPLAVAAFAIEADGGGVAAPGSLRGDRQGRLFKLLEEAGCTILPLESPGDELIEADDTGDRVAGEVDPAGAEIPETYVVAGVRHRRLKSVCDAVRRRASGRCEACGDVASFIRRSDGSPYLEVHHVIPLADGGADTVWNAAGICANCHARCHHGEDNRAFNARLYDLVPELRKSSSD